MTMLNTHGEHIQETPMRYLAIPAIALTLVGCSAQAEPQETSIAPPPTITTPEPLALDTPQTFEFTNDDGTKGTVTIPSEPYVPMEELYTLTGATTERAYASVDVDNRGGAEEYGLYEINLYTPEGEQVTLQGLNNAAVDLPPMEYGSRAMDLSDEITGEFFPDTAVGQVRTEYVVGDAPLPDEVARVEVTQTGGGAVQVYPENPQGEPTY